MSVLFCCGVDLPNLNRMSTLDANRNRCAVVSGPTAERFRFSYHRRQAAQTRHQNQRMKPIVSVKGWNETSVE